MGAGGSEALRQASQVLPAGQVQRQGMLDGRKVEILAPGAGTITGFGSNRHIRLFCGKNLRYWRWGSASSFRSTPDCLGCTAQMERDIMMDSTRPTGWISWLHCTCHRPGCTQKRRKTAVIRGDVVCAANTKALQTVYPGDSKGCSMFFAICVREQ